MMSHVQWQNRHAPLRVLQAVQTAASRKPALLSECHDLLAGILESWQYELLEFIGIGQAWEDGRPILKLWLKDPQRYEA